MPVEHAHTQYGVAVFNLLYPFTTVSVAVITAAVAVHSVTGCSLDCMNRKLGIN